METNELDFLKLNERLSVRAEKIGLVERISMEPLEVRVVLDLPAPDNNVLLDGVDAERVWATFGVPDTSFPSPLNDRHEPLTSFYNILQN